MNQPSRLRQWQAWLADLPLNRPGTTLGIAALLLALAVPGLRGVTVQTDYRIFFGADNPQLQAFEALQTEFSKGDGLLFVGVSADGQAFTPQMLAALADLTEAAWRLPYVQRVDSPTNFQHSVAVGDELSVAPLVVDPLALDAAAAGRVRALALAEPLLVHRLVSPSGHAAGVYVTLAFPERDLAREQPASVLAGRALLREFQQKYPAVEWRMSGRVAMNYAFREAALHDVTTIVPLALALALACAAGLIFWFSGSLASAATATVALGTVILFTILFTEGVWAHLGFNLNIVTANAATIVLTLAVADCLHLFMTSLHRLQEGADKREAIRDSLRINGGAVFLTSFTTVLGFLSMNYSDAPPFRELGNKVALGVAIAWLMAVTVFPALLMLLPVRWKRRREERPSRLAALGERVVAHRVPVLIGAGIVAVAAVAGVLKNELNDNWAEYFSPRMAVRQDLDFLRDNLTGIHTLEFSLSAGAPQAIAEPAYLERLDAFVHWLETQPEVVHVYSIADTFKRLNQNMHGDDPAWRRLPADRETAAQYLLLYELSLPMGLDLTDRVNFDKSAARVTGTLGDISTRQLADLQTRAQNWLRRNAPSAMYHEGSSASVMFAHIGRRNAVSMLQSTAVALLLIAGSLALVYRSLAAGVASLLVTALPALAGFGLWGLLVGRVGVGLSVVSGMIIGIVVDYTIHFLSKFLQAERDLGLDGRDATRYAFGTVGLALVVTTVVLCVNFALLGLSDFAMNAQMGVLTAGMILLALAANLLVLPPLLLVLRREALVPVIPEVTDGPA